MFDKLESLKTKYDELALKLGDGEIIADHALWQRLCKEHADMSSVIEKYNEYKKAAGELAETEALLKGDADAELRELAMEEREEIAADMARLEGELKLLLLPKDPDDDKNVIIEIRAGAGGEEAALFAGVLLRMYSMYAERRRWKIESLGSNQTDIGGFKEVSFMVEGKGAFSRLKYESGVHRVQRIPTTESGGRIHTSTVTVAVLPEAKEVEVEINPGDIRIDVFRAGGPGGQYVNTTDSAVRITHLETGLVVSCQDEKSQHKNREKAMKILRSRYYDLLQSQKNAELAQNRKKQVGTGDRSERIRTYNFPQGRVSDHRISLTLHKLEQVLNGELDEVIDALAAAEQAEGLKGEAG